MRGAHTPSHGLIGVKVTSGPCHKHHTRPVYLMRQDDGWRCPAQQRRMGGISTGVGVGPSHSRLKTSDLRSNRRSRSHDRSGRCGRGFRPGAFDRAAWAETEFGRPGFPEFHQLQIAEFLDAIRAGRAPAVTGRDARNSLAIILGIYESSRTGHPVQLREHELKKVGTCLS